MSSSVENSEFNYSLLDLNINSPSSGIENTSSLPIYNWELITNDFLKSCEDLRLAELVHDDMFGLFEAMSAIEMMDPKMDAGMKCNRFRGRSKTKDGEEIDGPLKFSTAIGTQYMPVESVSLADQIAVVDMTLSCLVTWLEGHSLAQTVFTNLYLHNPHGVSHPLLSSFSTLILKLVDLLREIMSKGNVYEEEDFQPVVYDFNLCQDISELKCTGAIKDVEDDLQKLMRLLKQKQSSTENDSDSEGESEKASALFSRMRFVRLLYQGLAALIRHEAQDGLKFLLSAKDHLGNVSSSIHLGTQLKEGTDLIGFDPWTNQRLLPPTFPRHTEIRSRHSTMEYLSALVDRTVAVVPIVNVTSLHGVLEFFMEFSASSPCILSRSILQVLYQPSQASVATWLPVANISINVAKTFPSVLRDSCKAFTAPAVLVSKTSDEMKERVEEFFLHCTGCIALMIQTFGHNRARQREKIPTLLEELANAQEEADRLDGYFSRIVPANTGATSCPEPTLNFSTWLLYHVLRLMVRYILSGFELELFSVHEYPYIYWYLFELLFPWLGNCLHKADAYLMEHEVSLEIQRGNVKNKKKSKINARKKMRPYARESTCYQGYSTLCAGYFRLILALKKENKISVPNSCFDNEAIRYEHRFAPFVGLFTPPFLAYSTFVSVSDHIAASDTAQLFLAASRDFGRARQIFETVIATPPVDGSNGYYHFDNGLGGGNSVPEMSVLLNVAKHNLVVASILSKDPSRQVEFEFTQHQSFPTLKLV